ncbi:Rieske (2Fe-2S) protein [Beggiatoa leptomitoformis]|uniref:Rieske 2Fe-2S domain-containing protein n=1 Tax=Beggiatoa leptomitoformis TaxID=288004 RepID=A0A2N9YF34_9GAMM|nr:Rieske (2Fe-2S) protein [Beggiatoa leptomitoformis]ALG68609.1 Rieske 2Fe-2S domain-containing protein [Beggiatoa leptomitoformis]AUI69046.1 Rieske 2Fe-2S domain-containing protein [Beggiatoa leptomitoformis]
MNQFAEEQWQPVAELYDIAQGGITTFEIAGQTLLFSRQGKQVHCFANLCTHLDRPLDMGNVRNGIIVCPFHGYEFDLETGDCLNAFSKPLKSYPVRVVDGLVQVCVVTEKVES